MAAEDHLSDQQFFHGTDASLKEGDLIHPGHLPEDEGWSADYPEENHRDFAWAAEDSHVAHGFGRHVYEVEPTGLMNKYKDYDDSGYHVSLAPLRVKSKVN